MWFCMVENDKKIDSNEVVNSIENVKQSIPPYNWMLDGESVLTEMPVKYVLWIVSSSSGEGGRDINYSKADIKKIIVTDKRIVFLNKEGELSNDKWMRRAKRTPRQFFFYDKNAFDKYMEYIRDHNQKIISDLRLKDPEFEENFNKRGPTGYNRKMLQALQKEGYITSNVFFVNGLNLTTQKAYTHGHLKLGVYKVLEPINGQPPKWFVKKKKKGIQIKAIEVHLDRIRLSKALAESGHNIMSRFIDLKKFEFYPVDFFIRINQNQIDDVLKLVDSIIGKILEMSDAYTDKKAAKEAVYEKYFSQDKEEE